MHSPYGYVSYITRYFILECVQGFFEMFDFKVVMIVNFLHPGLKESIGANRHLSYPLINTLML